MYCNVLPPRVRQIKLIQLEIWFKKYVFGTWSKLSPSYLGNGSAGYLVTRECQDRTYLDVKVDREQTACCRTFDVTDYPMLARFGSWVTDKVEYQALSALGRKRAAKCTLTALGIVRSLTKSCVERGQAGETLESSYLIRTLQCPEHGYRNNGHLKQG